VDKAEELRTSNVPVLYSRTIWSSFNLIILIIAIINFVLRTPYSSTFNRV
jgi:hypothetical protein